MKGIAVVLVGSLAVASGVAGALAFRDGGPGDDAPPGERASAGAVAAQVDVALREVEASRRAVARLEESLSSVERSFGELREENRALREAVAALAASARAERARLAALDGEGRAALASGAPGDSRASGPGTAPESPTGVALASPVKPIPAGSGAESFAANGVSVFNAEEAAREAEIRSVLAKIRAEDDKAARERDRAFRLEDASRRIDDIAPRLGLSPEQSGTLANLIVDRGDKMRDVWEQVQSGSLTREQARDLRRTYTAEYETQVQSALTPAQYEELKRVREEQERRGGGGDFEMGPAPPPPPGGGGTRRRPDRSAPQPGPAPQ